MSNIEQYKKRFFNLMESTIGDVKPLLTEEEKIEKKFDKKYDYKKNGDQYFYKLKNTNNWIEVKDTGKKGSSYDAIKTKVFNEPSNISTKTEKTPITNKFCQVITPKTDIKDLVQIVSVYKNKYPDVETYGLLNRMMNRYADSFISKGIPQRISCEISLIKIRPEYKDKNIFIVDTISKLIYLYDKDVKFIARDVIISGKNKQSVDPKIIARSLLSWEEQAENLGFKWYDNKGYVDVTGKNRKYDSELVYSDTDKSKTRFLPKGIFTTGTLRGNADYAGKTDNMLSLYQGNKKLGQAIHGYYIEQPRTAALQKAKELLSNPKNPEVSKEFMKLVSSGNVDLSQSYGCINLPESFLPYLRKYGPNSYVFNMGDDKQNYLVQNTENFFDKMINSNSCPSPSSLEAIPISNFQATA